MTGPVLRLLADDLTGALDSAAELTGLCGPVPMQWGDGGEVRGSLAIDTATRELSRDAACVAVRAAAPALRGGDIAFKKIDSLLRGHVAAELAACMDGWRYVVFAPAFPAQGRITRGGSAWVRQADGKFAPVAPDLRALLAEAGLQAQRGDPAAPLPPGLSVFDAETDSDLARIVALGRAAPGPVLWCGSGGLARALAGSETVEASTTLRRPVLGLFGSDQPATARQLAACGDVTLAIARGDDATAAQVAARMATQGAAMVSVALPGGLDRAEAARRIAAAMAGLTQRLRPPGTLIVAGGETLRAVCVALGALGLDAVGIVQPGVPRSRLRGGAWDGVPVISKSGAFGGDSLWRDLLAHSALTSWSIPA